ncbi:hypothetical protein AB205_0209780 [Aquarana catesbeiana]|uniref:Uncharacterized protein n=1 Tax=Aquarana catesbeiana TaxID=8400 RepID=A0A2G9SJF2_AQUCT|nr:hypothetical protein AB205_0209780 [Aquarana catesbeiana]
MAETQQVHNSSNEEENPEPETSRSRRRFKASNMSFVEMVDILKRADYDGEYGPYTNPNERKAKIMTKVVKSLRRNFGVQRSKEQLKKCWLDLKLREHDQYRRIKKVLLKIDVQVVVPKSSAFTSAQRMIQEIMFCSRDLDIIKEKTKEIEQRLKNIIDVLGRI